MRPKAATPVRATTHADTRSNIPTAELESFARPEEKRPTIVRYPRDPSLDPHLVWKGKDEPHAADLERDELLEDERHRPTKDVLACRRRGSRRAALVECICCGMSTLDEA